MQGLGNRQLPPADHIKLSLHTLMSQLLEVYMAPAHGLVPSSRPCGLHRYRNSLRTSMTYWEPPKPAPEIRYIEDIETLDQFRQAALQACCCGIDAEWPPDVNSANPSASLLQLALWSPHEGGQVLLLDMQALPKDVLKLWLQPLLRNKHTLKVGYSMVMDMRAVAAALGAEGGSCVAVVEPALDIGTIHRFLLKQRAPGVRKASLPGLSGIVGVQLGAPLNKQQQCSEWGRRPLTPQQLRYAAADALCLLSLLDNLAQHADPSRFPLDGQQAPAATPGGAAMAEAGDAAGLGVDAGNGGAAGSSALGRVEDREEGGSSSRGVGARGALQQQEGGGGHGAVHEAGSLFGAQQQGEVQQGEVQQGEVQQGEVQQGEVQQALQEGRQPGGWMACGEGGVRAAAEWWGSRLEISGARAVRRRCSRRSRAKLRRAGQEAEVQAFPAHVPWMDAARRLRGVPRFICDVMAEGLARQLRLVGLDAESLSAGDKTQRHTIYRRLVERAEEEGRVVLTRDQTFLAAGYTYQAYLVRADTKREQLQEVVRVFGLCVGEDDLLSRCAKCNGEFHPQPLSPEELPPGGQEVPEGIRAQHREFWVCSRCSCVYWQGNQYGHAVERLSGMLGVLCMK